MRDTEQVYRWEVDGLARRLDWVEKRLNRIQEERFRNGMLLLAAMWILAVAGIVALAALS